MAKKILVIEDERIVAQSIEIALSRAGYMVTLAFNGKEGLERFHENLPDLILLDIMMPEVNGWQICSRLREVTDLPIIMITALGQQKDIIKGLNLGADDYIGKPWSNRELLARVNAVLRRVETSPTTSWQPESLCKDMVINHIERKVRRGDEEIYLTPIEFRLLAYLVRRPGHVISFSELIAHIWGREIKEDINRLRWHIHNLRQKIEKDSENPQYLFGKHGMGYYCAE